MRNAFAAEITALAQFDPRIVLLSGDIGNKLFDKFKSAAPDRFYNCGVAEANMIGVAAGMAMTGLRPIAYTITPFVTTRCLEQIRVDVCYHNLPVIVAGVGAGLGYANLGPTHHSCEDIAFLRALPNMQVVAPGDPHEVRAVLRAALAQQGPVYIRMGKKGEPTVHSDVPADFAIGKGIVIREGDEVCILAAGTVLPLGIEAGRHLAKLGISTRVVSLHTIKPLDEALLCDLATRFKVIVTIEEHSRIGGLGAAVAQWLVEANFKGPRLLTFATGDYFMKVAGETEYARELYGITEEAVIARVREAMAENSGGVASA